MPQPKLFAYDAPNALRQPKTDRLVLERLLREAGQDNRIVDKEIAAAHEVIKRWADLDTSGKLGKHKETQLQGQFLAQVFGDVLGYAQFTEGADLWHQEQHQSFGGQTPDAVLGHFRGEGADRRRVAGVVELKGPKVHLDRDRSNGRTAVDQCWDYLVNMPTTCRWGIVSNYISFRLYERDSTKRRYEHFTLQGLRDINEFRRFYSLFHRKGLIEGIAKEPPRAVRLLQQTTDRQREVSDQLYDAYSTQRTELITYLVREMGQTVDMAVDMAQRLFDRVIFIAFCEDRRLLPANTIAEAYKVAGFHAVTNPRWQNFKNLFRFIDGGNATHDIPRYNGGLFASHPVDDLELPDEPWTNFFKAISGYDFADEVNLEVLGHLFERSITELEKQKSTGLFDGTGEKAQKYATMPQSVKRKQLGVYYTPEALTTRIVQYTVDELIAERFATAAVEHGIAEADARRGAAPDDPAYWRQCLAILRDLKIVDPACGSGAFLFQAYNTLEARYMEVIGHLEPTAPAEAEKLYHDVPSMILCENIYGVDLSPEAVEITQLALWIRSATRGQTLATLSRNIVHGNSLVHDAEVHSEGFDWRERFPEVYDRPAGGFDCVIGNPPWERIKLQEREFFSLPAPEIATATNAAKRRQLVARLESDDPALYDRYQQSLLSADALLTYCRKSKAYPLTGKGDINLYAVFAELAYQLVAPAGRVGLLTPSGIASDKTTKDFFAAVAGGGRLRRLYDFENRTKTFFPEVDGRFKFCIINFGGAATTCDEADFVFFAHSVEELDDADRQIRLSAADIRLLNPNTQTCPIFRTRRDAEITKAIYRRVPVLIDKTRTGPTGNPWGIRFKTMFHQTNDAEHFREAADLEAEGFTLDGNRWTKGKEVCLPLYEAKMVQAFDHRAADVIVDKTNWMRQGQTEKTSNSRYQNPEHLGMPRFWVASDEVALSSLGSVGFKDITSPTNQRTMIAAFGPFAGYTNHFVLIGSDAASRDQLCLLANLNCFALDFCARQKIGGVTLNFFIVEQLPVLAPDAYEKPCAWQPGESLRNWISDRVLMLTCTAEDMLPLAEACDFTDGSFQKEYNGRLHKWDEADRLQLTAELDAAFFHLYGVSRDDAAYILSTFKGIDRPRPLLKGSRTQAEHILDLYDQFADA